MGKLDSACAYLSGAMEMVADHGIGWRREIIKMAKDNNLAIDFIDPTNKPGQPHIIAEAKASQAKLQQDGNWKALKEFVGSYRREDLRFVDYCDFMIISIDPTVAQWGTADELYMAERQHKPCFFICKGGLSRLPRWLFDVIDLHDDGVSNVYESMEEVIDALVKIDQGTVPMSKEWFLIRKHLEESRNS